MVFDLDGTLLNTLQDLADCYNRVLRQFGFPVHPTEDFRNFIGDGAAECMKRCLPEAVRKDQDLLRACLAAQAEDYADNWRVTTRPYPGIMELLEKLTSARMPLGVLSNKDHRFTLKMVSHFFGHFAFAAVQGLDGRVQAKPLPDGARQTAARLGSRPERTFFVGDSSMDMLAASGAGQVAVGALWGFHSRTRLLEAGADELIETPLELLPLVSRAARQEDVTHD